ncbi:MAG: hypothetical protein LKF82_09335 [Acinetobacter populi]|jgi:hypothetical protein|uniref:hypothetical protein n=1 Tax=Acinetobacter populi TaxID=1582270 RepID=UPI002356C1E8|nr:hypothetical protein [Acinetobacter populi]MCH4248024.1 hypothetical protein [Acinetobacter populi]
MLGIASYFYSNIPLTKSVECGVFKEYKTFQSRHGEYEMLAIIMDKSGYIRYFNFDKSLPRIASHQHVCLELYDRFKNKGLSQSKILRIIAN